MTHPSLVDAATSVMWLDDPDRPRASAPLAGNIRADLVVVGGGYTGLWTALRAIEREPGIRVVILEAGRIGNEASGRNGGFASSSLTHGFANGARRWPEEIETLERLGVANLAAIGETIARHHIDCNFEATGELSVATRPHEVAELAQTAEQMSAHGIDVDLLDADQTRAKLDSPGFLAGLYDADGCAIVEPARLAWGLARVLREAGVRILEGTRVTSVKPDGSDIVARTPGGTVRASRAVLATNAFPPLLRRLRLMIVPVYDLVLATEPLSQAQMAAIGWSGREGVGDASNLFHYYRLTRDNRILWGGYDAVYHWASGIARSFEQDENVHRMLARHFFEAFPQLEGLRFTHRWGGVIDTSTRFTAFYGTAHAGRTAYAAGFTGLGVASTRFAAEVMLDLLGGEPTERTELEMVRSTPLPFPPEPARSIGINLFRWSAGRADATGSPNLFLRSMDKLGLGFDS
ncbi:MAG: NAD(P)/FAD-dependent oxidoreductase [Nocardioides sp.]